MKEETFEVKESDITLEATVGIDDEDYGWFEVYDVNNGEEGYYAEGGLWFDDNVLVDYDGVYDLPSCVKNKLIEWGYEVDM